MSIVDSKRVFVGLDYHDQMVQVCAVDEQGKLLMDKPMPNAWGAIAAAAGRFGHVQGASIEACCGAANLAKELADKATWNVSLAHPGFVARMKQNPDKTDYTDARVLADLLRVGYLPKVWLAPDDIRELRRLVRYRQELVNQRRSIKLRIRALLRDERLRLPEDSGRAWTKRWLAALQQCDKLRPTSLWILQEQLSRLDDSSERIRQVEDRLEDLVADDAIVKKLREFKGIGLITAAVMRAEIAQFDRFTSGKQLSKFCGLTPRNASSGNRQADAGLIKAGNKLLRMVLIEAAHRQIRYDDRWHKLACQLKAKGKPTCLVVAAVANRWMRWLYHQMQPADMAVCQGEKPRTLEEQKRPR
jgi:transposase